MKSVLFGDMCGEKDTLRPKRADVTFAEVCFGRRPSRTYPVTNVP